LPLLGWRMRFKFQVIFISFIFHFYRGETDGLGWCDGTFSLCAPAVHCSHSESLKVPHLSPGRIWGSKNVPKPRKFAQFLSKFATNWHTAKLAYCQTCILPNLHTGILANWHSECVSPKFPPKVQNCLQKSKIVSKSPNKFPSVLVVLADFRDSAHTAVRCPPPPVHTGCPLLLFSFFFSKWKIKKKN